MSLPNEILDPLLSGYLDDALSGEERTLVEQWLRSDERVRRELESLRELRSTLQAIDRADRPVAARHLGVGFADRVVDAAIEKARNEGVPEDHPLIRSSEAPVARRTSRRWNKGAAAAVVALAASGVMAIAMLAPERPHKLAESVDEIAAVDGLGATVADASDVATGNRQDGPPATRDLLPETLAPDAADIASVQGPLPEVDPLPDAVAPPVPDPAATSPEAEASPEAIASRELAPSSDAMESDAAAEPASDAVASASVPPPSLAGERPAVSQELSQRTSAALTTPIAVLVLDVRRTELGRFNGAVQAAMEKATISRVSQRPISPGIVASVGNAVGEIAADTAADGEVAGSVVYLEASAKRIDQFILNLLSDREGIESVGMSLAADAPLTGLVQSVEPVDPTEVRQGQATEFGSEVQGVAEALARHLGDRDFLPMNEAMVGSGAVTSLSGNDGADVPSRVFLLIR